MSKPLAGWGLVLGMAALTFACHRDSPTSPSAPAVSFSFSPMAAAAITQIVPLGNLNPPDHTLPTNHIYFYHPPENVLVTAPADGRITEVRHDADDSLFVQANTKITYYFYHLILDPGIVNGGTVTAGQRLGVTIPTNGALDLGVTNSDVTRFFVRPERYNVLTLHTDGPLKYFTDAVRNELLPKVQRHGDEKDGKIDFDQAGRLAGNWFLEGLSANNTEGVENGPKHLSFARDTLEPAWVRISIGGTITTAGAFYVQDAAPDPASVTTTTGRVAYELFSNSLRTGTGNRILVVQLIADDRIRIEVFPPGTPVSADFTGAAFIYTR